MRANLGSTPRLFPSYYCGTYGTYGKHNPAGCHCNRGNDLFPRFDVIFDVYRIDRTVLRLPWTSSGATN
jgi:hypothetical protein